MSIVMTGDFYRTANSHHQQSTSAAGISGRGRPAHRASDACRFGQDLLAEVPDIHWTTPYGEYYLRGGHRLWHAPEAVPRSSVPDNGGLTVEGRDGAVYLSQPPEPVTAFAKAGDPSAR